MPMDGSFRILQKQQRNKAEQAPGMRLRNSDELSGVDLNEVLAHHPDDTYLMKVNSRVMEAAGICEGDRIIVDRKTEPSNGKVVVAILNGELFIRKLEILNNKMHLIPASGQAPIVIDHVSYEYIWGVVTYVIHKI